MPERIEYCLANADSVDHPRAEGRLCLQQCGLCYESSFLLVDGEPMVGESHEALVTDLSSESKR